MNWNWKAAMEIKESQTVEFDTGRWMERCSLLSVLVSSILDAEDGICTGPWKFTDDSVVLVYETSTIFRTFRRCDGRVWNENEGKIKVMI